MAQETTGTTQTLVDAQISAMYKAGLHFGYTKTRRHPKMCPFIYGTKNNVEVFDLNKVLPKMNEALSFIKGLGSEGRSILFVGTKACVREAVRATADAIEMPFVTERWLGGTITNFKIISDRVHHWEDLKEKKSSGELKKYTKHEQLKISQEIDKLDYMFGGLARMGRLPVALVVVDINEEMLAVKEAIKRNIPIVALSSTDTDPSLVTYVIPANDNARSSVEYVLDKIQKAYKAGKASMPTPMVAQASTESK